MSIAFGLKTHITSTNFGANRQIYTYVGNCENNKEKIGKSKNIYNFSKNMYNTGLSLGVTM